MRFKWAYYQNTHEAIVDSWLDDVAINFTGLDDGWKIFYNYWMQDAKESCNCKDYCFIVSENNEPFCVIYVATQETVLTVSECVVAPSMRGKGYGSAAIKELIDNCAMLVDEHIGVAKAVIYPNNVASQKAFEKAGFAFVSDHPDGDAFYYECSICNKNVITHYDHLIDENNDPVYDPKPLQDYMDKWDGQSFIDNMELNENKSVLEIGVGTGRLALRVAPYCKEFCGIDISPKTIERAKDNLSASGNVTLICDDFISHDFSGKRFDVIYSSLTFMHISEKQSAIEKIKSLLNDGGAFVLSTDKNQSEFIDMGTYKVTVFPDTPETIKSCCKQAKLRIIKQYETEFAHVFVISQLLMEKNYGTN